MQISDELLVRLETAINTVMDDAEVDYPIGYHKGMHRVSWDAAEMRRALAAALSLPVQPVAWPEGFFKLGGDNRLRECASDGCHQHVSIRVERSGVGSDHCEPCARKIADLLTTPPISPTKGPEDDLIAARAAVSAIYSENGEWMAAECVLEGAYHAKTPVDIAVQSALLALRSRPASALPVVKPLEWNDDCRVFKDGSGARCCDAETVGLTGFYIIWRERDGRHTVSHSHFSVGEGFATLDDAKAAAQADYERRILSTLVPSVQP